MRTPKEWRFDGRARDGLLRKWKDMPTDALVRERNDLYMGQLGSDADRMEELGWDRRDIDEARWSQAYQEKELAFLEKSLEEERGADPDERPEERPENARG